MRITPSKKLEKRVRDVNAQTEPRIAAAVFRVVRKRPAARLKTILVTTDFSELSMRGVRAALSLGHQLGASVAVLHVVKPSSNFTGTETSLVVRDDLDMVELVEKELSRMAKILAKKNTRVEPLVRYGQPFHEITELARSRGVDLIVIATHGHTGLKRVLLGSTAERVVRHAPCPVLTIPSRAHGSGDDNASGFRLRRIVVPIDGSKSSAEALPYAARLTQRFGAEVVLLHVLEPPAIPVELQQALQVQGVDETAQHEARDHLLRLSRERFSSHTPTSVLVRVGVPFKEITKSARSLKADLIVLTTHGHTGLSRVLLGSTAERVVRHADCPVLTVRAPKRGDQGHRWLKRKSQRKQTTLGN